MALTLRSDGSTPANLINSTWFNDYYNLLTGVMQDQPVTIKQSVTLTAVGAAPSGAPSLAVVSGAGLGIGAYTYVYTYVAADGGESLPSPTSNATTTSGNQKINLTGITVGPTGTVSRKLYRSAVGTTSPLKLVTTIADNSTTTYSDTTADGSLGATAPTTSTFGGTLKVKNSSGTVTGYISSDGGWYGKVQVIRNGVPVAVTLYSGTSTTPPATEVGAIWIKG